MSISSKIIVFISLLAEVIYFNARTSLEISPQEAILLISCATTQGLDENLKMNSSIPFKEKSFKVFNSTLNNACGIPKVLRILITAFSKPGMILFLDLVKEPAFFKSFSFNS